MGELKETLLDLQNKAENCAKSDRLLTVDFLKKLINNLENGEEKETKNGDSVKDSKHKLPLKLTIRKFKNVDSTFVCHECHKTFINLKKMISHVFNTHTKAEVTCNTCKGTFYCYNLFVIHECIYLRQTVFIHRKCGLCEALFLQKKDYTSHMLEEHKVSLEKPSKTFTCQLCQTSFQLRSQLLVHTCQCHDEEGVKNGVTLSKFVKMNQSNVKVNNESAMVNNLRPKTIIKTRNWCSVCKRNFLSQNALNKHFLSYMHKVNSGELKMFKKFLCEECGNSFNKMVCLQRHMSSHHNDFVHKCNLCDYRSAEKCNLTEHMRRHYQIRNFACEFCEATFVAKRELNDHVAFKHNSQRPFECSDCGKMFKTKRILRRHINTHSEFKPYVCACGSSFLRMTNLRRHHLSVHHEPNPVITKVHVSDDQMKEYWYADSKFIKNKKSTKTLDKEATPSKADNVKLTVPDNVIHTIAPNSNLQILNINYMMKVSNETEKDPKMYWSINQNFLDQSDTNETIDKSSLQDSSVIEDSLNICDLVSSPSFPLLVSTDHSDDPSVNNKMSSDNISKYKVESIMMDSDNRINNLDGIWRPIDTVHQEQVINDDRSSSMVSSNTMDIFPQNPGLISSFNEVFLTSVSNNGYPDDGVQWNGLSLSNTNYNPDNSTYIYTGPVSACEPLGDNMPVSDSISASADNFLFYNQSQQVDNNSDQSFAYIESYPSNINGDHTYGSTNDSYSATFSSGLNHHSYQQNMQDIFALSYSSTSNSDFIQIPPNNSSRSKILFNQDQLFHNSGNLNVVSNFSHRNSHWLNDQNPSLNDFSTNDNLQPLILNSYKISSQIGQSSSTSMSDQHPLRILSPIDFFVSDNVFSSGLKQEYCLSLQDMTNHHDINVNINENPLMSDFCAQNHQFSHNSAQLCSKNFSVVNLISSANTVVSKDTDDNDLLYSEVDESVL